MFSLEAVVVLTLAIVIGSIAAALTLAVGAGYPAALIAAGVAGWAVVSGVPRLMR